MSPKPKKVFVSYNYHGYADPLIASGFFVLTKNIEDADIILFAGGEDVGPELYGEPVGSRTYWNKNRDKIEVHDYDFAVRNNIPMVGVCRGMQFLTAMHGGKIIQHVTNHSGKYHPMFLADGSFINVNSLHHQMCLPFGHIKNFVLVGYAPQLSSCYVDGNEEYISPGEGFFPEPEALYYPDINAFGVQWHPEMMPANSEAVKWFVSSVRHYLFQEA